MRTTRVLLISAVCLAITAAMTFAGESAVRLPDGETITVLEPGVGGVSFPKLVKSSAQLPALPGSAEVSRGNVMLMLLVKDDGSVGDVAVLDATDVSLDLDSSALDPVWNWRFRPARKNKQAVGSFLMYELRFRDEKSTRVRPHWPEIGSERPGLTYGAMSGAAPGGIGDVAGASAGMAGKAASADEASSGSFPAGKQHIGGISTVFEDWVAHWIYYPGGLIDMRTREVPPVHDEGPNYPK